MLKFSILARLDSPRHFPASYQMQRLTMYRTDPKLEVQLRLGELNRRSAYLFAVSSKLADRLARLHRLCKTDETIVAFTNRNNSPTDEGRKTI